MHLLEDINSSGSHFWYVELEQFQFVNDLFLQEFNTGQR